MSQPRILIKDLIKLLEAKLCIMTPNELDKLEFLLWSEIQSRRTDIDDRDILLDDEDHSL